MSARSVLVPLVLFWLVLVGLPGSLGEWPGPPAALADDDDGGDDDGGDDNGGDDGGRGGGGGGARGGGGRGGSPGGRAEGGGEPRVMGRQRGEAPRWLRRAIRAPRASPPRRAAPQVRRERPRPVRTVPLQTAAPNEIVAIGLAEAEIAVLVTEGYAVLQQAAVARLDATLVRFRVPQGVTLEVARERVRAVNPAAAADFNHFYRPVQACEALSCGQVSLVAWPVGPGVGGTCGAGARIGLVDTGINAAHEALAGAALTLLDFDLGRPDVARATSRHGTAVAAILLAGTSSRAPGLLPDAEVYAVDAFFSIPSAGAVADERTDAFSLVRAIDRVAAEPITVLNLSLAGAENAPLGALVAELAANGIVVVASVGNAGPQAAPLYPAAYPGVIGVTAVDASGRVFRRAGRGDHVDFAAPGVDVWTAASVRGVKPVTGTSFAAPFVTAAVALAQAGRGAEGHDEVLAVLTDGIRDLGDAGRDPVHGAGLVQAAELCTAADEEIRPVPVALDEDSATRAE